MASRDNDNPLLHLPCNTLRPAHEEDPDATSRRPGADIRVWPHCGRRTRLTAGIWDRVSLSASLYTKIAANVAQYHLRAWPRIEPRHNMASEKSRFTT